MTAAAPGTPHAGDGRTTGSTGRTTGGSTTGDWWDTAVVYEVYPRSFADADGDGVGDLPGVLERLPYLASLGVDALWLTPFQTSPGADQGYDISDPAGVLGAREGAAWSLSGDGLLLCRRDGGAVVAVAMGEGPVRLPAGEVVLASEPVADGMLPPDAAAWVLRAP